MHWMFCGIVITPSKCNWIPIFIHKSRFAGQIDTLTLVSEPDGEGNSFGPLLWCYELHIQKVNRSRDLWRGSGSIASTRSTRWVTHAPSFSHLNICKNNSKVFVSLFVDIYLSVFKQYTLQRIVRFSIIVLVLPASVSLSRLFIGMKSSKTKAVSHSVIFKVCVLRGRFSYDQYIGIWQT